MQALLKKKHTLWLEILFGAFSLPKGEAYDILLDFGMIEYRHLKWIAKEIVRSGEDFLWEREEVKIEHKRSDELFSYLKEKLSSMEYPKGALFDRIRSDEAYMVYKLNNLAKDSIPITAFSKSLEYEGLEPSSKKALIQFLFEEIYKEYELILTYTYSQLHTKSAKLGLIFEDLIYESIYHLKSFADLAAKLGILFVPREVMKEVYRFDDLKKFLKDGIKEEMAAKEQCKALSSAIQDEDLKRFFTFIDNQEEYHIHLMQEALEEIGNS